MASKKQRSENTMVAVDQVTRSILWLRGQRAMLDVELASLYGTESKALLQAVKRNLDRFPGDFEFQLTNHEVINLRS